MAIEVSLLIDWLWPFARGSAPPADIRAEYTSLWQDVIARLTGDADHGDTSHPARRDHGIVLRDYHSPNLIWRSGEQGLARVGIIDFHQTGAATAALDRIVDDAPLDRRDNYRHAVAGYRRFLGVYPVLPVVHGAA